MKEPEKLHQLPSPFQVNIWSLAIWIFGSRCLESSVTYWAKYTYRKFRSALALSQKISWCANGGQKQHLFQQHLFRQALLMGQDRGKLLI